MSKVMFCPPNVDCPCYAQLIAERKRLCAALDDIAQGRVTHLPLIQALAKAAIQHEAGAIWSINDVALEGKDV